MSVPDSRTLTFRAAVLDVLDEHGVRLSAAKREEVRDALTDRLDALFRQHPPADAPTGLAVANQSALALARTLSADERGTALSTREGDADPRVTPEQRAAFDAGELVMLPVTVASPGRFGSETLALVPVAPRDLRAGIEAARQGLSDLRARLAARLGDMPVAPERAMWRAHLDSGYLAVWFEDLARWRRAMLEEFVAPTGRRG